MLDFALPEHPFRYIVFACAICLVIRAVLSVWRWSEYRSQLEPQPKFWNILRGYGSGEKADDYLQPLFLGLMELLVYPILIANDKPEYIGAWLGLKVLPRLGEWSKQRNTYQRFLIGNAAVIVASYWLRKCFYA